MLEPCFDETDVCGMSTLGIPRVRFAEIVVDEMVLHALGLPDYNGNGIFPAIDTGSLRDGNTIKDAAREPGLRPTLP